MSLAASLPPPQPADLLARFAEVRATTVRHWWPVVVVDPVATTTPVIAAPRRRRLAGQRFMLTRKEPVLELFRALAGVECRSLATYFVAS